MFCNSFIESFKYAEISLDKDVTVAEKSYSRRLFYT